MCERLFTSGLYIIGISGVTNGGKTTMCNRLLEAIPDSKIFHQDDYYLKEDDPKLSIDPVLNHANWEELDSLDMDQMESDIRSWMKHHVNEPRLLIIEGFTIFNYKKFDGIFKKKYFFTLDKETCFQRRRLRHYEPPDVEGYFERIVWPMYLKNTAEITKQKDIDFIDGTTDKEIIFQTIFNDIFKYIPIKSG